MTVQEHIIINDETNDLSTELINTVRSVIGTAMESENIDTNTEVSITIVDNEKIRLLNRDYRQKDEPTDVLSFPMSEGEEDEWDNMEGMPKLLGDVVISLPRAEEQAKEYGHDLTRELCFLAVHGFLHLIGYDHETKEEEKLMFKKQEEILEKHGIKK